jgi:hypothetical protein
MLYFISTGYSATTDHLFYILVSLMCSEILMEAIWPVFFLPFEQGVCRIWSGGFPVLGEPEADYHFVKFFLDYMNG